MASSRPHRDDPGVVDDGALHACALNFCQLLGDLLARPCLLLCTLIHPSPAIVVMQVALYIPASQIRYRFVHAISIWQVRAFRSGLMVNGRSQVHTSCTRDPGQLEDHFLWVWLPLLCALGSPMFPVLHTCQMSTETWHKSSQNPHIGGANYQAVHISTCYHMVVLHACGEYISMGRRNSEEAH